MYKKTGGETGKEGSEPFFVFPKKRGIGLLGVRFRMLDPALPQGKAFPRPSVRNRILERGKAHCDNNLLITMGKTMGKTRMKNEKKFVDIRARVADNLDCISFNSRENLSRRGNREWRYHQWSSAVGPSESISGKSYLLF